MDWELWQQDNYSELIFKKIDGWIFICPAISFLLLSYAITREAIVHLDIHDQFSGGWNQLLYQIICDEHEWPGDIDSGTVAAL